MRLRVCALVIVCFVVASGCSSSDGGDKAGELGNGGFYFSCEDAVSCERYANDAKKFPSAVSLGSTFKVRFVPSQTANEHATLNSSPDNGITINPVGEELISGGLNGLVALKSGYASITSRDAAGRVIDFISLRVARPDTLVVYAADDVTEAPNRISTLTLAPNQRRTFRAFAQEKAQVLGGSLPVAWESGDAKVVEVQSNDGVATVLARAPGKTSLVAIGGTFTQAVEVEVKP